MPLTIEQQQLVLHHLEQKNADTQCRICKKGQLKVYPDLVCSPLAEYTNGNIKIFASDVITMVQAVCSECWHVELFMADGIFKSNSNIQMELI